MKYKDLIEGTESAFNTLVDLLRKPVKFRDENGVALEPYKFKSVVDGRHQVFEDAMFHIHRLKHFEDSDANKDMEKNYRARLQTLVDAVDETIKQVRKIQEMPIDSNESDDEKIKAISQSKSLSLSFLELVMAASENAKNQLSSDKPLTSTEKLNFASLRAKERARK